MYRKRFLDAILCTVPFLKSDSARQPCTAEKGMLFSSAIFLLTASFLPRTRLGAGFCHALVLTMLA